MDISGMFSQMVGLGLATSGTWSDRLLGDSAAKRGADYSFNEVNPNVIPPPEALMKIAAYYSSFPDGAHRSEAFQRLLLLHGIQFGVEIDNVYTSSLGWAWSDAWNTMGTYPSPDQLIRWSQEGRIPDKEVNPSLVFSGDNSGWWRNHYEELRQYPQPTEVMAMYNRGIYSEVEALKRIKFQTGWTDPDVIQFSTLVNIVPGPSDLIRFVIRDVFNEDLAQRLGLFEEFDQNKQFPAWCSAQGLRKMHLNLPGYGRVEADWPKMFWGAHWVLPSAGQAYEMLHRLRPNRVGRLAVGGEVPQPFLADDLKTLLKANDYAPPWRIRLGAIAFRPVGLRDMRRLFMEETVKRDELKEMFLDLGYAPDDSELLTKQMEEELKRKKRAKYDKQQDREIGRLLKELDDAFRIGFLDKATYLGQLIALDYDQGAAIARINATEMEVHKRLVEAQLKAIKTGYFNGFLAVDELIGQLLLAGITPDRAVRIAALWESQFTFPRRVASTETILDFVRRGLLNEAEAAARLRKLGWSNVDTLLHLLKERQVISLDLAKAAEKAARNEQQRQAAIKRQLKEQEAEDRRRRADFKSHSPPEWMVHWLQKGEISKEDARARWNFIFPAQPNDFDEWYDVNVLGGNSNGKT